MSATGTNTASTSNDVVEALNAMGWTQEDIAKKIRVLNRPNHNDSDKKVHFADCQTSKKLPLTEQVRGIQFYTLKDVEKGALNGRKICGHRQCKEAFEAIQRTREQQRTLALENEIEELKAAREADKRKEKKRLKMEKIKKMLAEKGLNCGSDIMKEIMGYDTDCDSVSNSVSNENGDEAKESDEVDTNELIPYSLSNMDIGSNNADADAGAGAGAGAGAVPKFVCNYCNKSFANEANTVKHMDKCKSKKNIIENDNA